MARSAPIPISQTVRTLRLRRAVQIARGLGFLGQIEYRHVSSFTGGASYGEGSTSEFDLLTVYAEAFDRDSDPDDFSRNAIIAHECGHQILSRHPKIAPRLRGKISLASEEVLASILGAIIVSEGEDRAALQGKAISELLGHGESVETALNHVHDLTNLMESLL